MNSQIKQLIDTLGTDVSGKWMAVDKVELLAELSVRECALLCSDPVVVLQHWGLDSESESVL